MPKRNVTDLTPTEFENVTYDLLQLSGMKSLVWRTPGADGGRDIEGVFPNLDFSGYYSDEKWYVECKLYSSSLDWPTVWKKISYADARGADFLLLVTNSNPSPTCETEITSWNSQSKGVTVRVWRGYEFDRLLSTYPAVASKYGLTDDVRVAEQSLLPMLIQLMKTAQASYVANKLDQAVEPSLEANAALAELVSARLDQLRTYGRLLKPITSSTPPGYDWLVWNGPADKWDEMGIRTFLSGLRYFTGAGSISVEASDEKATVSVIARRFLLSQATRNLLAEIALWADINIVEYADEKLKIAVSKRDD